LAVPTVITFPAFAATVRTVSAIAAVTALETFLRLGTAALLLRVLLSLRGRGLTLNVLRGALFGLAGRRGLLDGLRRFMKFRRVMPCCTVVGFARMPLDFVFVRIRRFFARLVVRRAG
jgi:hypothetical protein